MSFAAAHTDNRLHTASRLDARARACAKPSPEDEALFAAWQQRGDELAREQLVERYMPLARSLARRYGRSSEPFEDLVQVASLGLLKAVDRYDASRGHRFAAFAVPTILGEMRRYFRDAGWAVHVPRAAKERALTVRDAVERLRSEHGRSPTVDQVAQFTELDSEQVLDAMAAIEAYETCPLDARRPGAEQDGLTYAESLGEEDERYELAELDAMVCQALARVAPRERRILHLRFVEDLTQAEIAERVGVSQMQVSRLLRRSLDQMSDFVNAGSQL